MVVVVPLRDLIGLGILGLCSMAFGALCLWYYLKRLFNLKK